jgi:uncharacterized lipoprotein YmbA
MISRSVRLLGIIFLPAFLAGCGTTAPSHFYSLESTSAANGATSAHCAVVVGEVVIPAAVDRPEFVVQIAPNRVDVDEFNRWAAPLGNAIANTVAGNLAVLLGTPNVAAAPLANLDPDYRVTINVQRFESVRGEAALIDAVWTVQKTGDGPARPGRTVAREPVQGQGYDALAAGHSRALATLSADIAAAIRCGR